MKFARAAAILAATAVTAGGLFTALPASAAPLSKQSLPLAVGAWTYQVDVIALCGKTIKAPVSGKAVSVAGKWQIQPAGVRPASGAPSISLNSVKVNFYQAKYISARLSAISSWFGRAQPGVLASYYNNLLKVSGATAKEDYMKVERPKITKADAVAGMSAAVSYVNKRYPADKNHDPKQFSKWVRGHKSDFISNVNKQLSKSNFYKGSIKFSLKQSANSPSTSFYVTARNATDEVAYSVRWHLGGKPQKAVRADY